MNRLTRRGFTVIELLTVLIVIAVLASIMVLRFVDLKHRAISSRATTDMDIIRKAAYSRYYDAGVWPAGGGQGIVPADMAPYLPTSFSFARPDYTLEWENFVPPGGGSSASYQAAVRLTSPNPRLMQALTQTIGSRSPYVIIGNDLLVIVVGPDGRI
jgi:prepilin-type N-terminal cleavage/methylation domain-containing protein